jgi:hypothetical protein
MSSEVLALRVVGSKLAEVADAVEPGGSGDPYATLSAQQAAVLREVTRLGHPLRGWWQYKTLHGGAFDIVIPAVEGVDGSYAQDFWTKPGYEGHDDAAVKAARVQFATTVSAINGETLTLSGTPTGFLAFSDLAATSGTASGHTFNLVSVKGDEVTVPGGAAGVNVGDHVRVDNSLYIALSYFQRHDLPSTDQYGWNQYRDAQGKPTEPQRSSLVGEVIAQVFGGKATGRFHGKMIMLASVMDVQAYPWSADWYRTQARKVLGNQLDQRYRLWYMDNADHTPPETAEAQDHIVSYGPEVEQALLDLDAWVAHDVAPSASSSYTITSDNQVELAPDADSRHGVQPVVTLDVAPGTNCDSVSSSVRADVGPGQPVALLARAQVPPGAGKVVRIEWDPEGSGKFSAGIPQTGKKTRATQCLTHVYRKPGTYFAVVRVTAQRNGETKATFGNIENIARVRVVVR